MIFACMSLVFQTVLIKNKTKSAFYFNYIDVFSEKEDLVITIYVLPF